MKKSRWILIMRNFSDETCREYRNTIFFPKIVIFYVVMLQKYGRTKQTTDYNTIRPCTFYDA